MFKKHMVPLSRGGQTIQHAGKGSRVQQLSTRNNVSTSGSDSPYADINNYAKATPMAQPTPPAPDGGLGSGDWPGIGQ
jgi:hypothetical protein